MALARERTIPIERPPPVSEVSANFCHVVSATGPHDRYLLSRPGAATFSFK
jgi:hypothetical protein